MPSKKTATKQQPKKGLSPLQKKRLHLKEKKKSPLFEKRPRNFGIGQSIQPKRDLTRFVRWPKLVRLQRKKRILMKRLKVPPAINQFSKTLDKASATQLFELLHKYRPESQAEKKMRLQKAAEAQVEGKEPKVEKKLSLHHGINEVTSLIEKKQAKLVVISHDVEPIELVVWLPALCRKMDVPYCIVKSKSRLGRVIRRKTVTTVALTDVHKEDTSKLSELTTICRDLFNKNVEARRQWGGGQLGGKALAAKRKKQKLLAKQQTGEM
jgi:large subunit ribosomal protein L7Ae